MMRSAPRGSRVFGRLALGLVVVLALLLGASLWIYRRLADSLPRLDGTLVIEGLAAPVTIERDALGVATITGHNRRDVALATGFVHAQERFFQMDLQRRRAAGELAELVGAGALPLDLSARLHRFRTRAQQITETAPAADRALIDAYTIGVNAGLAVLRAPPFEYLLLGSEPVAWEAEDTVLTVHAMYLALQGLLSEREEMLGVMHDALPRPLFEFLAARGSKWDAPIRGGPLAVPPIPGPDVVDLRKRPAAPLSAASPAPSTERTPAGSNSWAVAGAHTAHGGALVADDMHLGFSVPNIWFRASLVLERDGAEPSRITGISLPGTPIIIVGSNGDIAWGFTNSMGDWSDLVLLEPVPGDDDAYRTPAGPRRFEVAHETIRVKDGEAHALDVLETIWGPVIGRDHRGRRYAQRWVAHDTRAVNLVASQLETSRSVDEALSVANRSGVPAQNFVVGDRHGNVGWTVIGPMPRRFGHAGRLPSSWADGRRGWDGWLSLAEYPRIENPPRGRVWTANARVVDGDMLERIGVGGYVGGARAQQIRDDLFAIEKASEADMLAIQLDDRALFLAPWRDLVLEVLDDEALAADPRRAALRHHVESWGGRAAVDSVGYRMVRAFRGAIYNEAFGSLTAPCREIAPDFDIDAIGFQQEGPLRELVTQRPAHLVDPRYASWDEQLLAGIDAVLDVHLSDGSSLAEHTWGAQNVAKIRHPLSAHVPLLSRWLDMPPVPLAGDRHMPNATNSTFGPTERMVVSPGREEHGIFHMPTGQSGHPLSPFYGLGHEAWLRGEATPFLPGPPRYSLRLEPETPTDGG